jgi:hypothetical protein
VAGDDLNGAGSNVVDVDLDDLVADPAEPDRAWVTNHAEADPSHLMPVRFTAQELGSRSMVRPQRTHPPEVGAVEELGKKAPGLPFLSAPPPEVSPP